MAKIISVINNKGGVGKTTSVAFFGAVLSTIGKRCLLVDTDESANLSLLFHHFVEDSANVLNGIEMPEHNNISEILRYHYRDAADVKKCIYQVNAFLDIMPSSKRLKGIPDLLLLQSKASNVNTNILLRKALQSIQGEYDYIFIDTAPRDDILIVNSLMASDYAVIPLRAEGFSFKGFEEVIKTMAHLKDEYDIPIEFLGTFFTAAELQTNVYKGLDEKLSQVLIGKNLPYIRKNVAVSEVVTTFPDNIIDYCASTNVLYDYCKLLIAMGILDPATESLLKKAYNEQ